MNRDQLSELGIDVSRETMEKLDGLITLILKWTKSINLIAPNTANDIWARHIKDSAQVYAVAPEKWNNWIDLGSGGGLPGLVVAILDTRAQNMTLVESDKRKCLFLQTARRELSLNISVMNKRIEAADLEKADVLSARALAPLPKLVEYANSLLSDDGVALFSKGERFQQEVDDARLNWTFDLTEHPSWTNAGSSILEISRIQRREPKPQH